MTSRGRRLRAGITGLATLAALAACGDGGRVLTGPPPGPSSPAFPGFDIAVYPGDATMQAWLPPATPYRWVGFYLAAPCHRDTSFHGKRPVLYAMGWGTAAIYVGQQTWEGVPDVASLVRALAEALLESGLTPASVPSEATTVTCSRTLLSAAQGSSEAADAVAQAAGEGFPPGSAVFLDVEYMSTITQPMLDYFGAWIAGVLADGRYRPAVYCARSNAEALHAAAQAAYAARKAPGAPDFWIESTTGFDLQRSRPADVGYDFARVWQGVLDAPRTHAGITLTVDEDVAASSSPSDPSGAQAALVPPR